MIELKEVSKRFGDNVIFDKVSQPFESGKIHGIIGRNGSGKTVLLRMIVGLYYPDSGSVFVNGKRIGKDAEFAPGTGFLIETPRFFPQFSGLDNLMLLARLNRRAGMKEARNAMKLVGLDPDEKKRTGKYSLGMRQRLGIAQAIMKTRMF